MWCALTCLACLALRLSPCLRTPCVRFILLCAKPYVFRLRSASFNTPTAWFGSGHRWETLRRWVRVLHYGFNTRQSATYVSSTEFQRSNLGSFPCPASFFTRLSVIMISINHSIKPPSIQKSTIIISPKKVSMSLLLLPIEYKHLLENHQLNTVVWVSKLQAQTISHSATKRCDWNAKSQALSPACIRQTSTTTTNRI